MKRTTPHVRFPMAVARRRRANRRIAFEALEVRTLQTATPTSITVTDSSAELLFGQSETLTATISVPSGAPVPGDGTVTFYDGTINLGKAYVNAGVATLETLPLPLGSQTITAAYGGTDEFAASTSGVEPSSLQSVSPGSQLSNPISVAADAGGDVYIGDAIDEEVFKVTPSGVRTTVASGLLDPQALAVDGAGDLFIGDATNNQVFEITSTGKLTTHPLSFSPGAMAADAAGDLYIDDAQGGLVVKVTPLGVQTTVVTGPTNPVSLAVDGVGDLFVGSPDTEQVLKFTPSGNQIVVASEIAPAGLSADAEGDVFIANAGNNQVVEVTATGITTTVGLGLLDPNGVAVDGVGDVFIADSGNDQVLKVSAGLPVTVRQATPSVSWADPTSITYGTALSMSQLDATSSVPGTFSYSPAPGTVLHAGLDQALSVTFTPADAVDYTTVMATVAINVHRVTPTVSWTNPGDITTSTALGVSQLDASSNVPGTFAYTPAGGAVLSAGRGQVLDVTFTPTDTSDYTTATATTTINVVTINIVPLAPMIIGEQALFQRKKVHGKPVGKPVLVGYMIDFNTKLSPSSAELASNYLVDTLSTKMVKKRKVSVLQPVSGFTVSYDDATASVDLVFTSQQEFKSGGQITVLDGPSSGVTGVSGAFVTGQRVLAISPAGNTISLA